MTLETSRAIYNTLFAGNADNKLFVPARSPQILHALAEPGREEKQFWFHFDNDGNLHDIVIEFHNTDQKASYRRDEALRSKELCSDRVLLYCDDSLGFKLRLQVSVHSSKVAFTIRKNMFANDFGEQDSWEFVKIIHVVRCENEYVQRTQVHQTYANCAESLEEIREHLETLPGQETALEFANANDALCNAKQALDDFHYAEYSVFDKLSYMLYRDGKNKKVDKHALRAEFENILANF